MKNKLSDLQNHLFATIEDLRDPDSTLDVDKAKQIANISDKIIASAKLQLDAYRFVNQHGKINDDFFMLPANKE